MTQNLPYENIILARIGEITLKGQNRRSFERTLMKNMARRLKRLGQFSIHQSQSRIWVEPKDEAARGETERALQTVTEVFGIVSASPVRRFSGDLETLKAQAGDYVEREIQPRAGQTFKVETRRADKHIPLGSMEISAEVGAALLDRFPVLKVDVHEPDFVVYCELREGRMFVYSRIVPGVRGLPTGTSGKAMLLLSGGIDSPVAGYLIASRGVTLEAIYFHTFPYTSDRAKEKVIALGKQLTDYAGRIRLHIVDFTEAQLEINQHCPAEYLTLVVRRVMMRIAERLAVARRCQALITGESLGQVASQTPEALLTTNAVVNLPVYRPLIGLDKDDTIRLARQIGTFETSVLPYEDCCTVFVAKHPRTRPTLEQVEAAEAGLDIEALVSRCLTKIETLQLTWE